MPDAQFYLREEPVCALDPLLLIPRIEYAEPIFDWVGRQAIGYSLVILDMQNFHIINDLFGYEAGDSVLSQFIATVRSELPKGAKTMRFRHGDEFLFFLPTCVSPDLLFQKIKRSCETQTYAQLPAGSKVAVTFRHAVVELPRGDTPYQEWLRIAEGSLRAVKGQGTLR